jgi:hypothetical protein
MTIVENLIVENVIIQNFEGFFSGVRRKKDYMGYLIVAKARGLKDCGLSLIDSVPKFHMSPDPEYGVVKVTFKNSYYGEYKIAIGDTTCFDTLIVIGLDKEKNVIKNVFVIPEKELSGKRFITITNTTVLYQKFEVDKKQYAQTYEDMKTGKYSLLEDGSIM